MTILDSQNAFLDIYSVIRDSQMEEFMLKQPAIFV